MLGWFLVLVYAVYANGTPLPLPTFSNPSKLVQRPTALDRLGLDDVFFLSSFQRQVFHGHMGAHLNVSLERLVSTLSEQDLSQIDIRLEDGRTKKNPTSLRQLHELFANNADSFVFHTQDGSALEISTEISTLKKDLQQLFHSPVTGNLYVSGSLSSALPPHTDTTDTIVIQAQGRKAWIFCVPHPDMKENSPSLPFLTTTEGHLSHLSDADFAEIQEARIGKLRGCSNYELTDVLKTMTCTNLTLIPGDVLYVPKGIVHMARELDGGTSVHLTLALGRDGYSFRTLFEQALIASEVSQKPPIGFFARADMSWTAVFQKAFKQLESSDSGISLRRPVPMWLLNISNSDTNVVRTYYQDVLKEVHETVIEILKDLGEQTVVSNQELQQIAKTFVSTMNQSNTFIQATTLLSQSPSASSSSLRSSSEGGLFSEIPSISFSEHPMTSRRLLACEDNCATQASNWVANNCPKTCSCDQTCNASCTGNCNLDCDDSCNVCTGPAPCNQDNGKGACYQNCDLSCDKSCDQCTSNCNSGCNTDCDDFCSSTCYDIGVGMYYSCKNECVNCPSSVNFNQAGTVTYSNTTRLNSVATFACFAGFSLSSSQTRVCQTNYQWSNSNPSCQPMTCNPPPVVPYSTYTPTTGLQYRQPPYNGASSNTTITWSCISGYQLVGPQTSTCMSNLQWSTAPTCVDINECIPTNPCIGGNCTNTNGGFTCACNPGYSLNGLTCVGQNCQPLTVPMTNAVLTYKQTSWQSNNQEASFITNSSGTFTCPYKCSAVLTCPTGYLPDPSISNGIQCDAPSTSYGFVSWNFVPKNQILACVGIVCPAAPPNGAITAGVVNYPMVNGQVKNPLRYQDGINVVCNLGYVSVGASSWYCNVSGVNSLWMCTDSNNANTACSTPTCVGRACAALPPVNNGYATVSSFQYPATIQYYCNPGYVNQGTDGSSGTCDAASGQWKNGVPYCVGKPCGNPPPGQFTSAQVSYTNLAIFPSGATYTCQTNYYSSPAMTTNCTTSGTWPSAPNCSFRIVNTVTNMTSTTAPSPITISGTFGQGTVNSITYGPYGQTNMFNCISPIVTSTTITCIAPPGVGANFYMVVSTNEFGNVLPLPKFGINYVQPVILKMWGFASSGANLVNGTNILKSDTRLGSDSITINGQHFGTDPSKISVLYGLRYVCSNIQNLSCITSLNCTLTCSTARGAGANLKFRLGAGMSAETMGWSSDSVATFSYPDGPSVSSVTGCPSQDPNQPAATILCPTKGGISVSLTGKVFIDPLFNTSVPIVTIGSSTCPVTFFNSTFLVCTLSSGTGYAQTVAVMVGDLSGDAQPLLSFAPATVTSVVGCINNTGCARLGGDVITINGKDFGAANAKVIIGGKLCGSVTHVSYTQLTCVMVTGEGLSQLVSVLQYDGQYTTTSFTISYAVCQAGQYDFSANTTFCYACQVGKYTDLTNRQFCDLCPLGKYQPQTGQSACLQAQYGQYVNNTGLTIVYDCPAGSYSPQLGGQSCTQCEAGRASNQSRQQSCIVCAPGRAQSIPGRTDCVDCPAGTYQSSQGMVVCNPCPSGTVAPNPQSPSCTNCLAGTYASGGTLCVACNRGDYADRALSSSCDQCGPGRFSTGSGLSFCQSCSAGMYQNTSRAFTCQSCVSGTFQQTTSSSSCDKCSPGYFSNSSQATFCYFCSIGYYTAVQGLTVCLQCLPGTYARDNRQSGCLNCDPGFYTNSNGSSVCGPCAPGYAAAGFGSTSCTQCLPGTANAASGQPLCLSCDYGTAANSSGVQTCEVCVPGKFAGTIASISCDWCVPGRFSAGNRSSTCDPCPAGTTATTIGATFCGTCLAGTYAPASGSVNCTTCSTGLFSGLPGATSCTSCNPGYFSNVSGTTQCSSCLPGTISPAQRMTVCTACDIGYFSLSPASTSCTRCPLGTLGNTTGAMGCISCLPGSYTSISAMTACSSCERGTYSAVSGATVCTPCIVGYYLNTSGMTGCVQCPSGSYQDRSGSTFCIDCLPGYFLPFKGGSVCGQCPRGQFTNTTRTTQCMDCIPGYYADNPGTTACFACLEGKISEGSSAAICASCDRGKYNPLQAQTACTFCPYGTYASQSGLPNCSYCQPGTFAFGLGNEYCSTCLAGTYGNTSGASTCTSCPIGRFSSVPSSQDCTSCDPGTYSSNPKGAIGCTICTRGYFQNQSAATSCDGCPPGSFGSNERMSSCQLCPAGKFRDTYNAQDCLTCTEGSFSNTTGSTVCTACSPGSYSASIGTASCILCALGAYTDKYNSLGCQSCDVGEYTNVLGTSTCSKCPIGTYQNVHGASLCLECIPGKYALEGYSECSPCQPQTANPWFGLGKCYRCADEAHPSDLGDLCICPKGTFAPDRDQNMSIFTCTTCNQGFDCTEEGVRFTTLAVKPGWWRPDEVQLTAAPCIVLAHCLGGHNSTCGTHRDGVLCAFCEDGYTASGTGKTGTCTECPASKSGSYAVIVLGSLGALAALTVIYYIVLISDRDVVASLRRQKLKELGIVPDTSNNSQDKSSRFSRFSRFSLFGSSNSSSVGPLPGSGGGSDGDTSLRRASSSLSNDQDMMPSISGGSENKKEKKNAVTAGATGAETRIRPNVVYKMKIVAGFLQILTNLTLSVTMPWPTHFRDFMLVFNFLNLDFLPWGTVGCVASLEYVDKIVIICSLPFFALFVGGIAIIVLHFYAKGPERPITIMIGRFRVMKLFAWTLFLLYPFLCATILKYFVCRQINDEIFLVADFAVHCYSPKWYKSLPVAVIFTIIYPVGVPVAFATFLFFHRFKLDDLDLRLKLGFLVDAYHRSTWWFEIVWSINKMFCVSVVAFFPTTMQIQTAMVWLVCFVIFLLVTRPYIRKGEDRLALLCMLEIILLLMFCLVLMQYNGQIDPVTDWVMSIGMIAMVCATLLVGLAIAIKNIYKIVRRWRFSWKKRHGRTNKPMLGAPNKSLVEERLDKNATVLEGRLPNSTGTASNTFEKDLAKFNFSAW